MFQAKNLCFAIAMAALVAVNSASAAVIETDSYSSTGFAVSNTDLINGVLPTSISGTADQEGLGTDTTGTALTNGQFGPAGLISPGTNPDVTIMNNGASVVYNFPTNYIAEIDTYTGWRDTGRAQQNYTVEVSTDHGATFSPLFSANSGDSAQDIKVALTSSTGGPLASGVNAIEFLFPNTQNGYVGYREIDVIKYTPEPSSLVLCGLGALGLMFVARRRRQA